MDVLRKRLVTTVSAMLGVVCLAPATGFATGTCYAFQSADPRISNTVDGGPPLVLRYIHTSVGDINTNTEAATLGHLKQVAFSVVGKATALFGDPCTGDTSGACPANFNGGYDHRLMTTIDGAIITGRLLAGTKSPDEPGAHMGINMHVLRRVHGLPVVFGPVTLECSSDVAGPNPPYWLCNIKAELGFDLQSAERSPASIFWELAYNNTIRLTRVNSNTTPACSVFQDGEPEIYSDAT